MKKILAFLILISVCSHAVFAKKLKVFFQYSSFSIPQQDPYLETYLTAVGNSVVFKKTETGKFQASIQITMLFKQQDHVKTFKKYNLLSPEIDDTLNALPNFIDQQRIPIPQGIYNVELIVADNNNPDESFSFKDLLSVDFPKDDISFSGVQFLEKYEVSKNQTIITKNGYDLYPYVSDFYPENINKLIFYAEIYNTDKIFKTDEFLLRYSVESISKNRIISEYSRSKKTKPAEVNILLAEFDINNLPSGNYNLLFEVVNKDNKTVKSKKVFFQRSKMVIKDENIDYTAMDISNTYVSSITNADTIKDYIKCVWPIATEKEKHHSDNVLKSNNVVFMQQFFYSFWSTRNFGNPQEEWLNYKKQVDLVNKLYKTQIEKGYETDRGRTYLQYGDPNTITENRFDPVALPNEIWHYYSIRGQTNIKFIFYNPDLTTNVYHLLHSDLKGEIQNSQWESVLYGRHEGQGIPENMQGNEHFTKGTKTSGTYDGRMKNP
ncbi:MAG: GWxTD domain-containing protein [Bacteroidia bacterium]|nr:GWxTD domain-containing protein [Bacteroidia bacterium]